MLAGAIVGEGNGTPLQYSCLENPMDGGAWWAAIHGVTKSRTQLSDFISLTSLAPYFITGEGNARWVPPSKFPPKDSLDTEVYDLGHQ